ncbi:phage terminase large subunit family protein [Bradyrhizobium sp. SZCCHNR1075]|uniref:phage terminase large subunit family protein n=1 Tax=Bradyrhizobium sp. SZCCHNR1075 TaxID=3057362 RepID=UPI0028EEAA9C|nr:phage terminase large subunit family protein [Bradyrhizobium sp. SZCCHNR1075]
MLASGASNTSASLMSDAIAVVDEFATDPEYEARLRAQVREIIAQSFSPPPKLTVSQWADGYRMLSPEASSEPGKWSTARVEPSRGIMDAFADPEIEIVTCMVAAQTVKTEVINNVAGYHVHLDPCPMLILQPTLQMAEAYSKDRLAPMIRDTPALAAKLGNHARDSEDTILHKKYAGGHITMAGANSPASLASRPIRILLCDEVDRYEASAGKEGDPVSLAIERTTTFWNRKIALVSTPTIKGASRIESSYEESDQRRFFVPCPKCGNLQHLRWAQVRWPEGNPMEARYHCEYSDEDTGEVCDYGWSEAERLKAIAKGIWIATRPEVKGHAGFHLNRIASPWRALGEMARDFTLVKRHPERLKTWVNTRLAETWEERGERADAGSLYERREEYDASVILPSGVGAITASVDIQDDRAEIEWCGWGQDDESWSLDYKVHYGAPNSPGFWEVIDHALLRTFKHPAGVEMRVESACIDSGGHFTQQVYDYVRPRIARKVYAIKGMGGPGKPIWPAKGTVNKAKNVTVFVLGVDQAKDMHYKRLELKEPGPGYCHFPLAEHYDKRYFDGLTAEKAVMKTDKRGFTVKEWHKVHSRNEPLDLRVYNIAARLSLGINMERRLAVLRAAAAQTLNAAPRPAASVREESAPQAQAATGGRRRVRSRGVER